MQNLGVKPNDVVHILVGGDHLDIPFAVLGAWYIGAIPAFGEATLCEEALVDQVPSVSV